MQKIISTFLGLYTLLSVSGCILNAQDVGDWTYLITGENMTIQVSSNVVLLDGEEPPIGSLLGVFFNDSNNNFQCAGYSLWNGSQLVVAAWGDDSFTSIIDGFPPGDSIIWVLQVNEQSIIAESVLMNTSTPYNEVYTSNGLGQLLQANFFLDESNLSSNEQFDYQISDCNGLNEYNTILLELNPLQTRSFNQGWNMFGFPCKEPRDVFETFSAILSDVYLVKNNAGDFFWPEFNFDGIGDLLPLEGYQANIYNSIIDFSFCENSILFPSIYGCTDCEFLNYNPFANIDDGSCE